MANAKCFRLANQQSGGGGRHGRQELDVWRLSRVLRNRRCFMSQSHVAGAARNIVGGCAGVVVHACDIQRIDRPSPGPVSRAAEITVKQQGALVSVILTAPVERTSLGSPDSGERHTKQEKQKDTASLQTQRLGKMRQHRQDAPDASLENPSAAEQRAAHN